MPLPRAVPVTPTAAERTTLKKRARGAKTAHRDRLRAQIVLAAARGRDNARIAADLQITADTVRKWRGRFGARGLDGLADLPAPGGRVEAPAGQAGYVPKSNGRRRGLGIPVIADRALQALAAAALEPEWEARFEPRSYGFRPGRGCHDAIVAIHTTVSRRDAKRVWALDADLQSAFDR